ncbi:uncharacterized protein C05D11.1-like [Petromyzon marinus]|uniref:Uncharacterized protein C05D11.1-like n=1 Tax=Petromyzon marinus TaxID=7757 RepID=A0AAJ7TB68_PETMA|nr:uncharacterized protein C05D11.1-like [Petromyzon marinus]
MAPYTGNFDLESEVCATGNISVKKFRSRESGLTVCLADVEGPLVGGHFCLATEAYDDDGLPHTLEHLVFMGSEEYPYKGVLDLLANRCLAQGTNAWTDTDHTCYTITTAGSEGFLNLLPIYLDHILYPTLTESSYITEVHHINGDGENAGVVYCEMQARENTGESRTHRAMLNAMYSGRCGYKSETGGMLENLRTSTSHKKVCDYHRTFYRPENLCLIITGQVDPEEVFRALDLTEQKIKSKDPLPPHVRPWQSSVPEFTDLTESVVQYPSDDETTGMVTVAWRGPSAKDLYKMTAIGTLLEYLSDTAISPLQRDLVEISDPYCNKVGCSILENSVGCVYIKCCNVPFPKLSDVKEKLLATLRRIGDGTEALDMPRMQTVIARQILEALNHAEDHPHEAIAFSCIGHFLYGDTEEELRKRLNQVEAFKKLAEEPVEYWLDLLNFYFVDKPCVTVVGEPSHALQVEMEAAESGRVERQRETLGEEGLLKCAKIIENALQQNEKEPPEEIVSRLRIPSTDSIHFHPIKPISNVSVCHVAGLGEDGRFPLNEICFPFQLDHVHSNFVRYIVMLDTTPVPQELKPYLGLYSEIIFESPLMRDGVLVPHEEVIKQLAEDTVKNDATLGMKGCRFFCGSYAHLLCIMLKVDRQKYRKGVQWIRELMHQVVFTPERIQIVATKILNEVPRHKRDGSTVVTAILKELNFPSESNHTKMNMIRQQRFLTDLLKRLETDPKQVIADMERVAEVVMSAENLRVHVSADVGWLAAEFPQPQQPWLDGSLFPQAEITATRLLEMTQGHEHLLPMGQTGILIGVGSVESSYVMESTPCITDYTHPDLPAIMVFIEYLTALEGPMWRQLRGLGLAYHYSMLAVPSQGLLFFSLYKSSHPVSAYKHAKEILDEFVLGATPWDPVILESSISSVIFEIIERETTVSEASLQSLLSSFRKMDNKTLLGKVARVTAEDLRRVGREYFTRLFDPTHSRCAVVCSPAKVEEISQGFRGLGRELTIWSSLEDNFP